MLHTRPLWAGRAGPALHKRMGDTLHGGSERACRKGVGVLCQVRGMGRDVGTLSSERGKGSVQYRHTHFMLLRQSRALGMEAVTGSPCGKPLTGPARAAVWKGWVISPGCFAWNGVQ